MSNLYEAVVTLIGPVPDGLEWLIFILCGLIVLMVLNSFVNLFSYILRSVGGIK